MDADMEKMISKVVTDILSTTDMEKTTESKVRIAAAERLGINLSLPESKLFIRSVVMSFLESKQAEADDAAQKGGEAESGQQGDDDQDEKDAGRSHGEKEYDDDGDLIICRLSNNRRVMMQEFRGKTLVLIKEFFEKDGKFPTS